MGSEIAGVWVIEVAGQSCITMAKEDHERCSAGDEEVGADVKLFALQKEGTVDVTEEIEWQFGPHNGQTYSMSGFGGGKFLFTHCWTMRPWGLQGCTFLLAWLSSLCSSFSLKAAKSSRLLSRKIPLPWFRPVGLQIHIGVSLFFTPDNRHTDSKTGQTTVSVCLLLTTYFRITTLFCSVFYFPSNIFLSFVKFVHNIVYLFLLYV